MGNKNSCCVYSSPQSGRKEPGSEGTTRNLEEHLPEGGISVNNLQHISEREPEDWDSDPSLHPCAGTIFMERSKQAIESKCHTDYKKNSRLKTRVFNSISF